MLQIEFRHVILKHTISNNKKKKKLSKKKEITKEISLLSGFLLSPPNSDYCSHARPQNGD